MELNRQVDPVGKKINLTDLNKEEIIEKYHNLVIILKKAKESKDAVVKDNNKIKQDLYELVKQKAASDEVIENLTQQKLLLTTSLQEIKEEKLNLDKTLLECQNNLCKSERNTSELETSIVSYKRQIKRLTEENENLISHLDRLEKRIEEFKIAGIEQREQLLLLEKSNEEVVQTSVSTNKNNVEELQTQLEESLNNIKFLESELLKKNELIENLNIFCKENHKEDLHKLHKEKLCSSSTQTFSNETVTETLNDVKETDIQTVNDKLKSKIKTYHLKLIKFVNDIKDLKSKKDVLINDFKSYNVQVQLWKTQLNKLSAQLLEELDSSEAEKKTLKQLITELEEKLSCEIKTRLECEKKLNDLTHVDLLLKDNFHNDFEALMSFMQIFQESQKPLDLKIPNRGTTSDVQGIAEEKSKLLYAENQELLSEMNDMNKELKVRGETISKQQLYCAELITKIEFNEEKYNDVISTLERKENELHLIKEEINILKCEKEREDIKIKEKDATIFQLESELQNYKDKMNYNTNLSSDFGECDTLSNSTISRSDEITRLKELEGPWEERYGKLRALAIKQKGKIRELNSDLIKEQTAKIDFQTKYVNSTQNIQYLQVQCDKYLDELDVFKKGCINHIKNLETVNSELFVCKEQLKRTEDTICKLNINIENLQKDKLNTDHWKKQVSVKVQSLKKELEANAVVKKDMESEIKTLQLDLEAKERALKNEIEKHNQTKYSLLESNNECKKQTVLSLEIQDYERSIKELSQKLEKKQELMIKLKNQLDSQTAIANSQKDQVELLEAHIKHQENDFENAKSEINILKSRIIDLDNLIALKESMIKTITENLETVRAEKEELSGELSTIILEHQKILNSMKIEQEQLNKKNISLEGQLITCQESLDLKSEECNRIINEYQGYKVRAQSVLKQNQVRDIGLEEKLLEESASLKAQADMLKSDIKELRLTVETLEAENQQLLIQKQKLTDDLNAMTAEIENYRCQLHLLSKSHQQIVNEHLETIRNLKVHADTISQCYKQQVTEQEVRHKKEIFEFQNKLIKNTVSNDVPTLCLSTFYREEGEGSECNDANNSSVQPTPLDKLLTTDIDQQLDIINKQLSESETKVTHLTALLADTEQDLVKHIQMNVLLKEEIRRHQRSMEREQHAENLEYMKNVIFKYITLNNKDERCRLVPVLTTILKLSPEETEKLNVLAKNSKGWSTFLPSWTPASKPQ